MTLVLPAGIPDCIAALVEFIAELKGQHMPLDPTSQRRMEILKFLLDRGGSCTREQWTGFDSGPVHFEADIPDLVTSGYVRHHADTDKYVLTEDGKRELAFLQGATDSLTN